MSNRCETRFPRPLGPDPLGPAKIRFLIRVRVPNASFIWGGGLPLPPYKCDMGDSLTALIPLLLSSDWSLGFRRSAPSFSLLLIWLLGFRDLAAKFPWVAAFRHRSSLVLLLGSWVLAILCFLFLFDLRFVS